MFLIVRRNWNFLDYHISGHLTLYSTFITFFQPLINILRTANSKNIIVF